jgi:predicted small integral membrane protein
VSEELASLEGLKTIPSFKMFEVAGHQIVFQFELTPLDMLQHATIYVPGIGRITYTKKVTCDSLSQATRWLEGLDVTTARKTLAYLNNKVKGMGFG